MEQKEQRLLEAVDAWLVTVRQRHGTLKGYASQARRFASWLAVQAKPADEGAPAAWIASMQGLSANTINNYRCTARRFHDWLKENGRLEPDADTDGVLEQVRADLRNPVRRWQALASVPKERLTKELCLEAVKADGRLLELVPEHLRTEAVCTAAVASNANALEFVPDSIKTQELCLEAAMHSNAALDFVPQIFLNEKFCLGLIRFGHAGLANLPKEMRTPAICAAAVRVDGRNLALVPKDFKTAEMCAAAMFNCRMACASVPEELRDDAMQLLDYVRELQAQADGSYWLADWLDGMEFDAAVQGQAYLQRKQLELEALLREKDEEDEDWEEDDDEEDVNAGSQSTAGRDWSHSGSTDWGPRFSDVTQKTEKPQRPKFKKAIVLPPRSTVKPRFINTPDKPASGPEPVEPMEPEELCKVLTSGELAYLEAMCSSKPVHISGTDGQLLERGKAQELIEKGVGISKGLFTKGILRWVYAREGMETTLLNPDREKYEPPIYQQIIIWKEVCRLTVFGLAVFNAVVNQRPRRWRGAKIECWHSGRDCISPDDVSDDLPATSL